MTDNKTFPIIETERLILRDIRISDIDDMFEYASHDIITQYVLWDTHLSTNDTMVFINLTIKAYKKGNHFDWGIELKSNGKFIGTAGFPNMDIKNRNSELGFVVSQDYCGQGIATEAAKAVLGFGFKELKLHRIWARHFQDNKASKKVIQKLGMIYEGTMRESVCKNDVFHNLLFHSILEEKELTRS